MAILDVAVVNVALPSIRHSLHFSEQDLQWVVNAYTVTFAGFLLLAGRAADLLGRRRVFVGGLLLFSLASFAGGLANSQIVLIAARAAQGLGGAVIVPASLSVLTTTFSEGRARNRAVGIWGATGGVGGAAGSVVGGLVTGLLGWRWILFINVPIGLVTALLAHRLLLEGRAETENRGFDLAGALTATVGLSLLVLGIVRTDVTGWASVQPLGLIAAGLVVLGVFILIEGRFAKAPLMPLRIWASRALAGANGVMLLVGASSFAMWFFLSLYLQQVLGYSALRAGVAFFPMSALIAFWAVFVGRLVTRTGAKPILVAATVALAAGMLLFSRMPADGTYLADVLPAELLVAIGIASAFVPITLLATAGVARGEAGLASGLVNTSRLFGGALGLAILAALATERTNRELRDHAQTTHALHVALASGFQLAFTITACFAVVAGLIAFFALPNAPARVLAPPGEDEPAGEVEAGAVERDAVTPA